MNRSRGSIIIQENFIKFFLSCEVAANRREKNEKNSWLFDRCYGWGTRRLDDCIIAGSRIRRPVAVGTALARRILLQRGPPRGRRAPDRAAAETGNPARAA